MQKASKVKTKTKKPVPRVAETTIRPTKIIKANVKDEDLIKDIGIIEAVEADPVLAEETAEELELEGEESEEDDEVGTLGGGWEE